MRVRGLYPLGAMLLAGCGAVLAPGPFLVPVESQPPGAVVWYEDREVGPTPCLVPMRRSCSEFELRLGGYHPRRVDVGEIRNPWVAANILTLGLTMLVDVALGTDKNPNAEAVSIGLAVRDGKARGAWRRWSPTTESTFKETTVTGHAIGHLLAALACL